MSVHEPRIGAWYVGEYDAGAFCVLECDVIGGVIHLRAADGRRLRMTFDRWYRQPLVPAQGIEQVEYRIERFEWNEPAIG